MAKTGSVQFMTGVVKAQSVTGQERFLHTGDKVQPNEKLITGAASSIVVLFDDGTRLDLGRDSQVLLNQAALTPEIIPQQPHASKQQTQQAAQDEVAALQKALQDENVDPTKTLPATAAGAGQISSTTSTGNSGHTFVEVDYLNPQSTPDSGFSTQGINHTSAEIPIEILILNNNAPVITPAPPVSTPTVRSVVANDPKVTEGADLNYTTTLSAQTTEATTYPFILGGGTASASDYINNPSFSDGVTYDAASQTITVPAGISRFSVTVPTVDDSLVESATPETLPLTIGGKAGIGSISDNDIPKITSVDLALPSGGDSVIEGNNLIYNVNLNTATVANTTYAMSLGGTASASDYSSPVFSQPGITYNAATQSITLPAGIDSFSIIVPTIDDNLIEGSTPENLLLTVGGITGTGLIIDNDIPNVTSIQPTTESVIEGNTITYRVTLSENTATASVYTFNLGGGTATENDDYNKTPSFSNGVSLNANGTLTVPAGVNQFEVIVNTVDDTKIENPPIETLPLSIGGVLGIGQIVDNDIPSITSIQPSSESVIEGNTLNYRVTLSENTITASVYAFNLGGGSATENDDYNKTPSFSNGVFLNADGTLTVPAGIKQFDVIVNTIDDTKVENPPIETLPLSIGGVTGIGQIIDNDIPSITSIKPLTESVTEGNSLGYRVTLIENTVTTSVYAFNLGGGTATASDDYNKTPNFTNGVTLNADGSITVPAGITQFDVIVNTIDDSLVENPAIETLPLSIGGVSGTGQIVDNDIPRITSVQPSTDSVVEGNALSYHVTLSENTVTDSIYSYNLGGGTATENADYNKIPSFSNGVLLNANGTLTVPAGINQFDVIVNTIDDTKVENPPIETLPLSIGGASGTGQIVDNDLPTTSIKMAAVSVIEGNTLIYHVTLSEPTIAPSVYSFKLGGGTATETDDYNKTPSFTNGVTLNADGTITVPTGVTQYDVKVITIDDRKVEGLPNETVPLTIGNTNTTAQIVDNDVYTPPAVDLDFNNSNNSLVTKPITGLFNTGVDGSGKPLTLGLVDPHYSIISQPLGGSASNLSTAPSSNWLTTGSSTSNWLGSSSDNPVGAYQYQTAFSLAANANPATVQLSFDIAFDNYLSDILINGVSTGLALTGGATQYSHVQFSGMDGWFSNSHSNTLTFVVQNSVNTSTGTAGETGLRINNLQTSVVSIVGTSSAHRSDYAAIYVEGTPVSISDSDIKMQDLDFGTLQRATITLTNPQAGDQLIAPSSLPASIQASVTGNVIKLTGTAGLADYQLAIKNIQFNNTSQNPNSTVDRNISVIVNNGKTTSNIATATIHVVASPDKPILDLDSTAVGTNYNTTYEADSTASVAIASANTLLTDVDSVAITSATIHITNALAGDLLTANNLPTGLTASNYDTSTGTLLLSGNASLPDYQTAIHNITFSTDSATLNTTPRMIEIFVNDGMVKSGTAVSTINITSNTIDGNSTDNVLTGTSANDAINGNGGNDTIFGDEGNDVLKGGQGDDLLSGNAGNDILIGGDGNDLLTGGAGTDTFTWKAGDTGTDIITDFKTGAGGDVLNFADLLQGEHNDSASLSHFLVFNYDQSNNNTTISIDADQINQGNTQTQNIVLQNIDVTASGSLSNVDIINNLLANANLQTDA